MSGDAITFRVLGPLQVERSEHPVALGAAMHRRLLGALLCRAGQAVRAETLINTIWYGSPPRTARKTLQVYVRRLRQAVGEDRVRHGPAGYALGALPGEVDAARFTDLVARARTSRRDGDLSTASDLLRQGLGLWRGEPYADVMDLPGVVAEADRLAAERLLAIEERAAVDLELGRHVELVTELTQLVRAHPYRERLRAYLMVALHRSGLRVEALATYRHGRDLLVDELGVEPAPDLRRLHEALLRGDDPLEPAMA